MSAHLKIVIVENEPTSRKYLMSLLAKTEVSHEVVETLDSVATSIDYFSSNHDFDLVFMDINLGDGDSFEILNEIAIDKPIIFCTSFDAYAIEAFKYNSIYYILKPAKLEDVQAALDKFKVAHKEVKEDYLAKVDQMLSSLAKKDYKNRFLIRKNNRLSPIPVEEISCFYSEDGYIHLTDNDGKSHIVEYTLDQLEGLVDPEKFFRINRQALVSIDDIITVDDYFNNRLKIKMKRNIPIDLIVSRNRVKDFKTWLSK